MNGRVIIDHDNGVVTLTLSNPARRNAISPEMYDALEHECTRLVDDASVRTLVLRGAGAAFAGGTDIRSLADIRSGDQGVEYEAHMRRVQGALLALRIPIIAMVNGACVGGGLVLAALSDIVFCTPASRFGSPIARTIGNTLSATSLASLQQRLGRRMTSEMLLTGRLLSAQEAHAAGFVTAVLDEQPLEERLASTLQAINACAPLTLRSFKELERRIDAHLERIPTDDVYREIYDSADFREGVDAFLSKRPARFEGR